MTLIWWELEYVSGSSFPELVTVNPFDGVKAGDLVVRSFVNVSISGQTSDDKDGIGFLPILVHWGISPKATVPSRANILDPPGDWYMYMEEFTLRTDHWTSWVPGFDTLPSQAEGTKCAVQGGTDQPRDIHTQRRIVEDTPYTEMSWNYGGLDTGLAPAVPFGITLKARVLIDNHRPI